MDPLECPNEGLEETRCRPDSRQVSNSSNCCKMQTVSPAAGEHPLQYNYTFWYSRRTPSRPASTQSYEQNIRRIGTVASVEQFWKFYSHLVRPGELSGHSDFHLFKEGIKPMWEGPCPPLRTSTTAAGASGSSGFGKGWRADFGRTSFSPWWGSSSWWGRKSAAPSYRYASRTSNDQITTSRIRDTLRRVLNLPANTIMEYKTHNDSLRDNSSFRNTKISL
ncbi:eukaryotic translation initiation factor 4E family member 2 related sequence 1 isoform X2 [Phycodurus eques]|uniref:eukaryotic translation initiation factor 4E family member 2 related sequence 1 isoform X2 n=1 Tax=Phycodurus eques TaxID=693459 RepID=UPI002ACE6DF2|nr:eukaryotic translation initiation factor 4E family member 2 related sequence 1 isoform X2 [Phycodurus eques]